MIMMIVVLMLSLTVIVDFLVVLIVDLIIGLVDGGAGLRGASYLRGRAGEREGLPMAPTDRGCRI